MNKKLKVLIALVVAGMFHCSCYSATCYGLTNAACTTLTNGASCSFTCPNGDGTHSATVSDRGSKDACYDVGSGKSGKTGCDSNSTICSYTCGAATCPLTGLPISGTVAVSSGRKLSGNDCVGSS